VCEAGGPARGARARVVLQRDLAAQKIGDSKLQEAPADARRAGARQRAQHLRPPAICLRTCRQGVWEE